MKTCLHCGIELTDKNWHPSCKKKGYYICKTCQKAETRKHYLKNRDKIIARSMKRYNLIKTDTKFLAKRNKTNREYYTHRGGKQRAREARERRYKEIVISLGSKCEQCGFDDLRALEIHHKNGRPKNEQKRKIINKNYPLKRLQLLCSNCHQIIHHSH